MSELCSHQKCDWEAAEAVGGQAKLVIECKKKYLKKSKKNQTIPKIIKNI